MHKLLLRNYRLFFHAAIVMFVMQVSVVKAHPHSWVSVFTEIEGNSKQLTGLTMFWTFDLITTSDALTGQDLSEENRLNTLQRLATEMLSNIESNQYFTHFKMKGQRLAFEAPQNGKLVLEDSKLTLQFFLALKTPLLLPINNLTLAVYEDSYYVDLLWLQKNDIQLSEHFPADCELHITEPHKPGGLTSNDPLSMLDSSGIQAEADKMAYDPLFIGDTSQSALLGKMFTQSAMINCL